MLQTWVRFETDFAKLRKDIIIYIGQHPKKENPKFLVMNTSTARRIEQTSPIAEVSDKSIFNARLFGIRIAINDELENDIIEIVG